MPYGILERPSLALGSLQASLRRAGFECRSVYANLEFAARVGTHVYNLIGNSDAKDLLGEWTFARSAFGSARQDDLPAYHREIYFDLFARLGLDEATLWRALTFLRDQADLYVDELAARLVSQGARVVGCSSTFQQHCPSLALLRRLKQLDPGIVTLMGGANCEGPMGLALKRNCSYIDYLASGESDLMVVDLLQALSQTPLGPLPEGVVGSELPSCAPRVRVRDLDALATPDYQEYFEALQASGLHQQIRPALAVETSRGCWWGEKHHCTFCGLNGSGMGFRSKSAARAVQEFQELSQRHQLRDFLVVDNILGLDAFRGLLPQLAELQPGYRMFVETKANLKRAQVETLAAAGAGWILPGLEGLHDDLLRLMDKGTTGVTNLQTLKWCRELGMRVSWSVLWGFPEEKDEWFAEMAEWVPALEHLQPPASLCRIGYHRFSPYHTRAEHYGLRQVPAPAYARVYPFPPEDLVDLAYFFEDAPGWERQEGPGLQALRGQLAAWAGRFEGGGLPAILSLKDEGDRLDILDTRRCATRRRHQLVAEARDLYLACDAGQSLRSLSSQLALEEARAAELLEEMLANRLVHFQNGRYLALATRGNLPDLWPASEFPGGSLAPRREGLLQQPWLTTV